MTLVSVALLSKPQDMEKEMNPEALKKKILEMEKGGADFIHWDVMDGMYNSNDTMKYQGHEAIKEMRPLARIPFLAHLMIERPEEHTLDYSHWCNPVIFHYEACKDVQAAIMSVKRVGCGIAIEPHTDISAIKTYLSQISWVLVMSVQTGYAGQPFIDVTSKIKQLDYIRKEQKLKFKIAVDGGINGTTGKAAVEAGADMLSAASYILNHPQGYKEAIESLKVL